MAPICAGSSGLYQKPLVVTKHCLYSLPPAQFVGLDPFDKSVFSVTWAGEVESKNWMHIAREYTEKFLHQQQIRDAVDKPHIMTKEFFFPFADICTLALAHTFRNVDAEVIIGLNEFWKLVSKSKRYPDFEDMIQIKGDKSLAPKALTMVSFMA